MNAAKTQSTNFAEKRQGCMRICLGVFAILGFLAVLRNCFDSREKDEERNEIIQTVEGRATLAAKKAFNALDSSPSVSVMPQVDGSDRIKIEYRANESGKLDSLKSEWAECWLWLRELHSTTLRPFTWTAAAGCRSPNSGD